MESSKFWKAIAILLKHYHAINKKIFACKIEKALNITKGISKIDAKNIKIKYTPEGNLVIDPCYKTLQTSPVEDIKLLSVLNAGGGTKECEGFIVALKFLTKGDEDTVKAVGFIDLIKLKYVCLFHSPSYDDFSVSLVSGEMVVKAMNVKSNAEEVKRRMEFCLKPKLLKWAAAGAPQKPKKDVFDSLHLIDLEDYNDLYKRMKKTYSDKLMEIWCENTDPQKYIFEDIAIAAYLICLWEAYNCQPTEFVDLGCGNGLLVYLLNQEGYKGCGYDVRSRQIWEKYPQPTNLLEKTIDPKTFEMPPNADWIIGNHSDELSPWIPVIAALTNPNVKYFLLPCCPYEFSGKKYMRRKSNLTTYDDFLNFLKVVSKKCGFITLRDRLKIPSTKRIAIIGMTRGYPQSAYPALCKNLRGFVKGQLLEGPVTLRESKELVRNCTQINSEVLTRIVKQLFEYLLGPKDLGNTEFNHGTKFTIRELAEHLSMEDLKVLKSECGGLQTLLKNKHEIFEFLPDNFIQIRCPKPRDPNASRPQTVKKRECFFLHNHPQGCPLTDEDCTFIHNT